MAKDLPRLVLKKLSAAYGINLLDDIRRLEVLMNEYCGFDYQEVQALLGSLQHGWVERLMVRASGAHTISLYERISQEMRLGMGIGEELAFWTVSTWAEVLISLGQIPSPQEQPRILTLQPVMEVAAPPVVSVAPAAVPVDLTKPEPVIARKKKAVSAPGKGKNIVEDAAVLSKALFAENNDEPVIQEKRRLERIPMSYYFRVFERWRRNSVIGHLVDANSQGVMLISEQPIKTNKIFRMKLFFPVRKEMVSVEFDAKSLWNKDDMMDGYFDTGFSLTDISQKDLNRIEAAFKLFGLTYIID